MTSGITWATEVDPVSMPLPPQKKTLIALNFSTIKKLKWEKPVTILF